MAMAKMGSVHTAPEVVTATAEMPPVTADLHDVRFGVGCCLACARSLGRWQSLRAASTASDGKHDSKECILQFVHAVIS
jgi:hypothetical protein